MGLELAGPDDLDVLEGDELATYNRTPRLAYIVKLATEHRCKIKIGDIEVEPLQELHSGPMVMSGLDDKSDDTDEDDRWSHTNMRPPNLREKRGEAPKG